MNKPENLYNVHDEINFKYYMIPQQFFTEPLRSNISNNAILLYSLLVNRFQLSRKNNWVDEDGDIYFKFERKEMQRLLGLSDRPVKKAMDNLIENNLIYEINEDFGRAKKIYLRKFDAYNHSEQIVNSQNHNRKKSDSQSYNDSPNKNKYNKNNNNNKTLSKDNGVSRNQKSNHKPKNNDSKQRGLFGDKFLDKNNNGLEHKKYHGSKQPKEYGLAKIQDAKNNKISWDNVSNRDFLYYYIEKHNKIINQNLTAHGRDVGRFSRILESHLIKEYKLTKDNVCRTIDILLDKYKESYTFTQVGYLSFYMISNQHKMISDLMRQVKKELDNPNSLYGKSQNEIDAIKQRKKESRNKHMEKVRYMQGINKKIKAGTATQEEINYYNENAY